MPFTACFLAEWVSWHR